MDKLLTQIGNEVRELTAEEVEQYKADQAELAARAKIEAETAKAKATAQATAQEKLAALGLTEDDLKALGL